MMRNKWNALTSWRTWMDRQTDKSGHGKHRCCHCRHIVSVIVMSWLSSSLPRHSCCHCCHCHCHCHCCIITVVIIASWLLLYRGCSRRYIITVVVVASLLSLSLCHCCHCHCVVVVVIIMSSSLSHRRRVVLHCHHIMSCCHIVMSRCRVVVITLLLLSQLSHGEHEGLGPRAGTGGSYSVAWDAAAIVGEHR